MIWAKKYRRQLAHDGVYATATLMTSDDALTAEPQDKEEGSEAEAGTRIRWATVAPKVLR